MDRNQKLLLILIPLLVSASFFSVAFTPVEVLGCRTRGLIAISIALLAGLAGICTAIKSLTLRFRSQPDSHFWILSTLILALPSFYIVLTEL
ncbi:MAG: hypothetical protein KKG47_01975 [Proteobacteria bacterium]|nr:hypothetical protein [Pseudomonadota bacterium]MBU1737345.1 hypothetical protein [Pseudomonadota bacterium]